MGSTEAKAAPQEGRLTDHVWPRGGRPGHEQLGVQTLGDKSARRSRKYKELLQQETPHSPSQRPDISPKTTDGHTHVERCSDPRSRGKRESEPPRDPAPPGPAHTEERAGQREGRGQAACALLLERRGRASRCGPPRGLLNNAEQDSPRSGDPTSGHGSQVSGRHPVRAEFRQTVKPLRAAGGTGSLGSDHATQEAGVLARVHPEGPRGQHVQGEPVTPRQTLGDATGG